MLCPMTNIPLHRALLPKRPQTDTSSRLEGCRDCIGTLTERRTLLTADPSVKLGHGEAQRMLLRFYG
ncbi:hypothetical protein VTK56DRAFT_5985 [Thermocarpiscus australiensis]